MNREWCGMTCPVCLSNANGCDVKADSVRCYGVAVNLCPSLRFTGRSPSGAATFVRVVPECETAVREEQR